MKNFLQSNIFLNMKHIFISIISLVISIIAIGLCTIQVTPSYSINEQTYIGIIATLIGVLVTFVVGYQILNTLSFKDDMRKFEEKTKEIDKLKDELYLLENKIKENFELSSIRLEYSSEGWTYSGEGFKRTHKMLIYSLNCDRDDYTEIFELLRTFIPKLDTRSLFGPGWVLNISKNSTNHFINSIDCSKLLSDAINEYDMEITKDQKTIRNHANFRQIRSDYERTMKEYQTRIEEYRNHPL